MSKMLITWKMDAPHTGQQFFGTPEFEPARLVKSSSYSSQGREEKNTSIGRKHSINTTNKLTEKWEGRRVYISLDKECIARLDNVDELLGCIHF